MKIYKKKEFFDNGVHTNKYYFCGIRYLKKIWSNSFSETYLFKIRISRHNNKSSIQHVSRKQQKPVIFWFDHSLGGGTETYSLQKFKTLINDYFVLRIQYFHILKKFNVYSPNLNMDINFSTESISDLKNFLTQFQVSKIVINNLVGYPNSLEMLNIIKKIKQDNKNIHVSYMGHDFQSICPQFNLMNCDGEYCNLKYKNGCEECWKKTRLGNNDFEHKVLSSGATIISLWKKAFADFFENTVDEMIVFSEAIKDIFTTAYPVLKNKIVVIPHEVKKFPRVIIPKHNSINIACLGNICSYNKGATIIRQMCKYLENYKDIKLFIIGNLCDGDINIPSNINITGKYNPDDLPEIVKYNNIDIIFIPSVWPETFSYTTSEAMSMGLPVACFNLGAPAERVSKYKNGLIITKTDAKTALEQIIEFINNKKE